LRTACGGFVIATAGMGVSATCNASASLPHLMLHRNIDAGPRRQRTRSLTFPTVRRRLLTG
jgi:hypothetical protein